MVRRYSRGIGLSSWLRVTGTPGSSRFRISPHPLLVLRVDDRPEQADRDRLDAGLLQVFRRRDHILLVQLLDLVAHGVDAAAHLAGAVARNVGRREVDLGIEGALARRFAQGEDVGMAGIADQAGRRDLALHQRIGRDGGAVDDEVGLAQGSRRARACGCRRRRRSTLMKPFSNSPGVVGDLKISRSAPGCRAPGR